MKHFDHARNLFEDLTNNFPKRNDIWQIYLDQEIKYYPVHNNIQMVRNLFERMITLKSSTKNIKLTFKKYLSFELKYGNSKTQESVKQKAKEYVSSLM